MDTWTHEDTSPGCCSPGNYSVAKSGLRSKGEGFLLQGKVPQLHAGGLLRVHPQPTCDTHIAAHMPESKSTMSDNKHMIYTWIHGYTHGYMKAHIDRWIGACILNLS